MRVEKREFGPSGTAKYGGSKNSFRKGGNNLSTEQKVSRLNKPSRKVAEFVSLKDDASEDEDNRRIAELEKKLGLDNEKRSKVAEDGLDGLLAVDVH